MKASRPPICAGPPQLPQRMGLHARPRRVGVGGANELALGAHAGNASSQSQLPPPPPKSGLTTAAEGEAARTAGGSGSGTYDTVGSNGSGTYDTVGCSGSGTCDRTGCGTYEYETVSAPRIGLSDRATTKGEAEGAEAAAVAASKGSCAQRPCPCADACGATARTPRWDVCGDQA